MKSELKYYTDYYVELCANEESWVHAQLADERMTLDQKIKKLQEDNRILRQKYGIVFSALTTINVDAGKAAQAAIDVPDND